MPLHNVQAIILRNRTIGEADRLITFFTQTQGKVAAVAKGAGKPRSKFGGSLQPLTLIQLIFFAKENFSLGRISSVDIVHSFQILREDWEKTKAALYLVELVERFSGEGERNLPLFTLFSSLLQHIEEADTAKLGTLLRIFEIRLLTIVGYAPLLDRCVSCSQAADSGVSQFFSPARGGWLCRTCQAKIHDKIPITAGTIRFLQKAISLDLQKIDRLAIPARLVPEVCELLHRTILLHLGRDLKSYRFLHEPPLDPVRTTEIERT